MRFSHPVVVAGTSVGRLTDIPVTESTDDQRVVGLVLVDVVPRYEKNGNAHIWDFMFSHINGLTSLD